MRNDLGDDVRVAYDSEVETPTAVDPRLPFVFSLAVFLGAQRRVVEVGCASNGVVLSVVHLWSDTDPAAINIRLISARRSTQADNRQYQEGI